MSGQDTQNREREKEREKEGGKRKRGVRAGGPQTRHADKHAVMQRYSRIGLVALKKVLNKDPTKLKIQATQVSQKFQAP